MSHRLRDRPAVRAARKSRSARQPERCADRPKTSPRAGASHFYPRSPRGERPVIVGVVGIDGGISIHAPRKGSDSARSPACQSHHYFYPHSPQGERRQNPTNIKDGFCVKVPNKNLKYTKQNAILCIQHNFNIDGRGLQGGVRCESSGQTMCAGTSRGQCAAAHNRTSL